MYHDSAESESGHLIIVDGHLSLIGILLVSVDDNVHFDGFAASAGGRGQFLNFLGCQFPDNQFGLGDQINQHLGSSVVGVLSSSLLLTSA